MKITFFEGQLELAELTATEEGWFNPDEGEKFTPDTFRRYREHELRKTVKHVYEHSRFYKKKLDEAGIKPEDIKSFEDIQKLPFTYPDDLRGDSYEFLCMSQRYVERPISFYSSGTTGIRKRMFYSFEDTKRIKAFIGIAMNSIADTDDTRILSLMTNTNGRGASSVYVASVQDRGMEAFAGNMEDGAEEILRTSVENRCNVWFGDIGTIFRTAKELEGKVALDSLGIKLLYVTMGNISQPVRKYLEKTFGCPVITHYGLTEVGWGFAIEKPEGDGYYSNEAAVYTEVINPETGEPVPEGEEGELTFTIIGKDAMPLLRYRCGDIATIRRAKDNTELDTIGFIRRRLEGTITSPSGINIHPAMIEEVIYSFDEVMDYRLYNTGNGLKIEVELTKNTPGVIEFIGRALDELPGINELEPTEISVAASGSLKQYCYEKKRFILLTDNEKEGMNE